MAVSFEVFDILVPTAATFWYFQQQTQFIFAFSIAF